MVNKGAMKMPYKQQHLTDALGLSLVHINETLGAGDMEALANLGMTDVSALTQRPIL